MANTMTQAEVKALMLDIGMNQANAQIASAISLCEAPVLGATPPRTNFDAVGDLDLVNETWGPSIGAFQIRSVKAQTGTGGWRDIEQLVRPRFNARAAREIYRAWGNWKAWSTFTSGAYLAYMQDQPGYEPPPNTYIVVGGDTLSGIADKVGGFTWQTLARENNLHEPYTLMIGQILILPPLVSGQARQVDRDVLADVPVTSEADG